MAADENFASEADADLFDMDESSASSAGLAAVFALFGMVVPTHERAEDTMMKNIRNNSKNSDWSIQL